MGKILCTPPGTPLAEHGAEPSCPAPAVPHRGVSPSPFHPHRPPWQPHGAQLCSQGRASRAACTGCLPAVIRLSAACLPLQHKQAQNGQEKLVWRCDSATQSPGWWHCLSPLQDSCPVSAQRLCQRCVTHPALACSAPDALVVSLLFLTWLWHSCGACHHGSSSRLLPLSRLLHKS